MVLLLRGLLHGVLAATQLREWGPGRNNALPAEAIPHLTQCVQAYYEAWPLRTHAVESSSSRTTQPAFGSTHDRWAVALDLLAADDRFETKESLDESTWLVVRRLLEYLLEKTPRGTLQAQAEETEVFETQATMLLYSREPADGRSLPRFDPPRL